LTQSGLPRGSLFTLADRNGVVIYRNLHPGKVAGSRLKQSLFRRMASGSSGITSLDFGTPMEGELGALGRSFDEMARQLELRRSEFNQLQQSLELRVERETTRRLQQERLLACNARLAAIGEMIGAIAHQWRQPLATLGATVQGLRMAWERRILDADFLERAEADAQKQLY